MQRTKLTQLKSWLLEQAEQPRRNLRLVLSGALLFFAGLVLVYYAESYLSSSIKQELTALVGLLCMSGGAILAAIGYLSLSILRILRFIDNDQQ